MSEAPSAPVSGHAGHAALSVACDGGGGALGHPRVYLELDVGGRVCCPYCSRTYAADEHGRIAEVKA